MNEPAIVFEDYYVLVLHKPEGYTVEKHPTYPSCESFAHAYLKKQYPNNKTHFVGIVHRLDVLVSGLLVIAKTRGALKNLNQQFAQGATTKLYEATIQGKPLVEQGKIEGWIAEDKANKKAMFYTTQEYGTKYSLLHYTTLSNNENTTVVSIKLETGRFHQIRASFAAIGHPIVNDVKYGAAQVENKNGIFLQAVELLFLHPKTNEPLHFKLPY